MDLNVAQIDFILEMEALDNPKEWTFTRPGASDPRTKGPAMRAGLFNFFIGAALRRFIEPQLNKAVLRKRQEEIERVKQFGVRRSIQPQRKAKPDA